MTFHSLRTQRPCDVHSKKIASFNVRHSVGKLHAHLISVLIFFEHVLEIEQIAFYQLSFNCRAHRSQCKESLNSAVLGTCFIRSEEKCVFSFNSNFRTRLVKGNSFQNVKSFLCLDDSFVKKLPKKLLLLPIDNLLVKISKSC